MHSELYCNNLAALDPVKAIRAIHQAHLQLAALDAVSKSEGFDNFQTLAALAECLRDAGHIGFIQSES